MTTTRDVNDTVFVTWTVLDPANGLQPTDPVSGVVAKFKDPSGNVTTYTYGTDLQLSRISTGVYQFPLRLTTAGNWYVRFDGTDNLYTTADETLIPVSTSVFP